jgi:hypothetical protein
MPDPDLPISGGCMCGAVHFEVAKPLTGAVYCHCKRCQRRSGTGVAVTARTAPGSFRITAGAEHVRSFDPADGGWVKSFCAECGGQLFTTSCDDPDLVAVRMGALDEDPGIRPGAHQYVAFAPAWAPVPDDDLPRFPERVPLS